MLSIKNRLSSFANSSAGGWALRKLHRVSRALTSLIEYLDRQRRTETTEDLKTKIVRESFPELTVLNGPFKGLKYPSVQSTGSALLPKLLGSYEMEAAPLIEKILSRKYTDIVDVGCAEGFYAVGFGMLYPEATVHAYDVDAGARRLCQDMAKHNGIENRVKLGKFCDPAELKGFADRGRTLVVADCEGYEAELFTSDTQPALVNHDILIECHDFKDPEISSRIEAAFAESHHADRIRSEETYFKAHAYGFDQLDGYSYEIRKFIMDEARKHSVVWLLLSSRANT
ncbi:MAG: methyltransferase [Pseudomonadota bacterium]